MLLEHPENLRVFHGESSACQPGFDSNIAAITVNRAAHVDFVMSKKWKVTHHGCGHNASVGRP